MICFPHCKINLGLTILSKREDGFHNLETCFYPVPRTDILEVIKSAEFSFTSSGTVIPGAQEENLSVKAFRLLQRDFQIENSKIHLHKLIPLGAGLGGGSSDAAFTLRLLNQIFELKISPEKLITYASHLGSDCAFFIDDKPMIGTGRGNVLRPLPLSLKGYTLVLVKPNIHIATADAYSEVIPARSEVSIVEILAKPVKDWRNNLKNDFEESIFKKFPMILKIKEAMYSRGALYASMSGSGSSVFGLFEKPYDLRSEFVGMDYWSGELK